MLSKVSGLKRFLKGLQAKPKWVLKFVQVSNLLGVDFISIDSIISDTDYIYLIMPLLI